MSEAENSTLKEKINEENGKDKFVEAKVEAAEAKMKIVKEKVASLEKQLHKANKLMKEERK